MRHSAAAALIVLFTALPALAAPDARYKAAVKLEVSGDVVGALAAFEAIPPAERDVNVRLHIASCKRQLNRYRDAERELLAILQGPSIDSATRETAGSDLEDLRRHFPTLRVRATTSSPDLLVTIDGATVTVPTEVHVDPGDHTVVARRGEVQVYRREVHLSDSESITLEIDAPPAPKPQAVASLGTAQVGTVTDTRAPARPEPLRETRGDRTSVYVAFGASAALLVGGVVMLFPMGREAQRYKDSCALPSDCDESRASAARRWQTLSWIGFGGAIAAAGVGTYLHLTIGPTRVGVAPSADRLAFTVSGVF